MKLLCQQCNHDNELERIYCHNCGTKLDRSTLPVEDPNAKKKKKRMGPSPLQIFLEQFKVVALTLLAAALAAAIICIFKPVLDQPEVTVEERDSAPFISTELEALTLSPAAASQPYTQKQLNAVLADKLKTRKSDSADIKSTDGFLILGENRVTIVGRCTMFGLPTGFQETWEVNPIDYPAKPKLIGMKLGCLTLPVVAAPVTAEFRKVFWKRLDSETKLLQTLGAKVTPGKAVVFTKR